MVYRVFTCFLVRVPNVPQGTKMSKQGPKFTVFLDYSTGDSFHTEDIHGEEIGFVWTDYDQAYKAAQLIKNHNDLNDRRDWILCKSAKDQKLAWDEALESEWHKLYMKLYPEHEVNDEFDLFYRFAVEDDKGDPVVINPFWHGYFERLKGIRVGTVNEDIL